MTLSLLAAFVWLITANFLAMLPSRDNHWRRAYVLIAVGIPLLGWITAENGPWVALMALAAGASLLRWPIRYLGRWMLRIAGIKSRSTPPAE